MKMVLIITSSKFRVINVVDGKKSFDIPYIYIFDGIEHKFYWLSLDLINCIYTNIIYRYFPICDNYQNVKEASYIHGVKVT